ncbi:hypothetical protein C1H46_018734 [Malus baccata]|uniref:Uncharacterized protein n=1 Tax=Malus baccata TaxID=106549 RepID=A0A540MA37_MALBA|nr:hypothetical protein C1H46_018734 [Malus baccata]
MGKRKKKKKKKKKKSVGELTSRKTSACSAAGEDDVVRYTPYVVYLPSYLKV